MARGRYWLERAPQLSTRLIAAILVDTNAELFRIAVIAYRSPTVTTPLSVACCDELEMRPCTPCKHASSCRLLFLNFFFIRNGPRPRVLLVSVWYMEAYSGTYLILRISAHHATLASVIGDKHLIHSVVSGGTVCFFSCCFQFSVATAITWSAIMSALGVALTQRCYRRR